jgi:hypothetical protein
MPAAIARGSSQTEVQRRREARPRPQVEEEERTFDAPSRAIGRKKGQQTLEDRER